MPDVGEHLALDRLPWRGRFVSPRSWRGPSLILILERIRMKPHRPVGGRLNTPHHLITPQMFPSTSRLVPPRPVGSFLFWLEKVMWRTFGLCTAADFPACTYGFTAYKPKIAAWAAIMPMAAAMPTRKLSLRRIGKVSAMAARLVPARATRNAWKKVAGGPIACRLFDSPQ